MKCVNCERVMQSVAAGRLNWCPNCGTIKGAFNHLATPNLLEDFNDAIEPVRDWYMPEEEPDGVTHLPGAIKTAVEDLVNDREQVMHAKLQLRRIRARFYEQGAKEHAERNSSRGAVYNVCGDAMDKLIEELEGIEHSQVS